MARTASPPRHGPEQGLWLFILIAVIIALAFVSVILFAPGESLNLPAATQ